MPCFVHEPARPIASSTSFHKKGTTKRRRRWERAKKRCHKSDYSTQHRFYELNGKRDPCCRASQSCVLCSCHFLSSCLALSYLTHHNESNKKITASWEIDKTQEPIYSAPERATVPPDPGNTTRGCSRDSPLPCTTTLVCGSCEYN